MDIAEYWNKRFQKDKLIWGEEPSGAALMAIEVLKSRENNYYNIIDIACGYGRDSALFKENNYEVSGIDISEEAIALAKEIYPQIDFMLGDVFNLPFEDNCFDVVFGNFIIHLFTKERRESLKNEIMRITKPGGMIVLSVASTDDPDFGKGELIEENCYVNERGVIKFYFTRELVLKEFEEFKEIDIFEIVEEHDHDFPHVHKSFTIFLKKGR